MKTNKKIIFTAGGTGGHIFPAINLMKHFFDKGYEVVIITDKRGKSFINKNLEFKLYETKTATITNKNFFKKILSLIVIFYSIFKSILILRREKPNLIIGFGGYVSFPTSFVSKFLNLPLVIYEPNTVLGRANRYLLFSAKKIFLAKTIKENFPKKYRNKFCIVGPIINKNIVNHSSFEKKANKEKFSILVLGGSQGAEIFGKIVPPVVNMIKEKGHDIQINQQCIMSQKKFIIDYYKEKNIKSYIFEFDKNILNLILSSDLAITRSGASTTAELNYTLTPFIAVPLAKSIDDHQHLNAKFYEERGCCWLIDQNNFNQESLFNLVIEIINNKNKLKEMREKMKKNCTDNVYSAIEKEIGEMI